MKKQIYNCCMDCGRKYGKKDKRVFGVWNDTCDICGKENVPCASAGHDFGIYNNPKEEAEDKVQDLI